MAELDLVNIGLETALATVVVAGIEAAAFAMVPVRFLPGASVFRWSRRVWLILFGSAIFGFFHILLNPAHGYLADGTRTPLLLFAVTSIGFWT